MLTNVPNPPAPVKTRTVIDQSQTSLYCSEVRSQDHHLDMSKLPVDLYHEDRPFSPHPAFLNPASHSPPPASPTLPPLPPNSCSARLSDAEQSGSSCATSTGYGTLSHDQPSPTEEPPRPCVERQDSWDLPTSSSTLSTHEKENGGYNGGTMMAARRLASLLHALQQSAELSPPSIPSCFCFGAPKQKVEVTSKREKHKSAPPAPFDWQALVYNHGTPSDEHPSFGSPSRESNVVKEKPTRRQLYVRNTCNKPRPLVPRRVEGRSLVPDVEPMRFSASSPTPFHPRPLSTASYPEFASASAYSGNLSRSSISLSRNQSEANVARSQLGSVREKESHASTTGHRKRSDRGSMISTEECNGPLSLPERRRLAMASRNWSYDNVAMLTYPVMPAIPVKQIRHEKIFVADGEDISLTASRRPLNVDERDRMDTEVSRRRGESEVITWRARL
ncbi:hypothetical protein BD410DRAFT_795418 [Rickenella mellea]|uniref:Uncharacterized protein n=1 Tax=Rickenella mellea TaxID=50990 RepID=A0A4Y7PPJ3_9AGAM|nr:hypothetical protein BD410DRAFT_795418 [Rickenella mellea]